MENLQDTALSIHSQYGIDTKAGLNPNAAQSILITEAELGIVNDETLSAAITMAETEMSLVQDPKVLKDLGKKLENLKKISARPEKPLDMTLENKWKSYFPEVDNLINSLDNSSKAQLLSNVFINENPKWHPERNSLVHIKIVASRGISTGDEDLEQAALFHDIAKFDTVSFNSQGWPTSLGHDKAGAISAEKAGCNDTVIYICNNHMKIKGWQGDSEGGTLNPSTKYAMFAEAPGEGNNEKAVAFWKLCQFSKMDNMAYDFNASSLRWDLPSYDRWDEECPLANEFKKAELVEIKVEKAKPPFTAQELMAFGAKGPQIGQINGVIMGKSRPEAFEIIKLVLGNPDLQLNESRRWIKTFESFRGKF